MKVGDRSFNQESGQNQSITPVGAFLCDASRATDVSLTPTPHGVRQIFETQFGIKYSSIFDGCRSGA
jgi:hypothetical protein